MKYQKKYTPFLITVGVFIIGFIGVMGVTMFQKDSVANVKDTSQDTVSVASLKDEEENAPKVVTEETASQIERNTQAQEDIGPNGNTVPQPTYDEYGPSTKLDRPDVHGPVTGLYPIYADYLFKLQSVAKEQRQAVSNQFISEHKDSFSATYFNKSVNSSGNLSLLHYSPDMNLPASIKFGSAIVSPDDPTVVLIQVLMDPDIQWSIIVQVKLKDYLGNIEHIENTYVRQNRNPL